MGDKDETDLFSFQGSVGPDGENRREDVIKAQTLLAHTGDFPSPFNVPTGWPSSDLFKGIKAFQKRHGKQPDGTLLPIPPGGVDEHGVGESLNALHSELGNRFAGQIAPTPQQVDAHYEDQARFRNTVAEGAVSASRQLQAVATNDAPLSVLWQPPAQGTEHPTAMPPVQPLEHVDPEQSDTWPESPIHLRFRDEIARREVGDLSRAGYGVKHGGGALGRYQFTDIAQKELGLRDDKGRWHPDNPYGARTEQDFLQSTKAQEQAFRDYMTKNEAALDAFGTKAQLGQTIQGVAGEFTISEAGLAAAAHRQGASKVKDYLNHLKANGWISDVNTLPDTKDKTQFLRIETRLREFSEVPYRRDQ